MKKIKLTQGKYALVDDEDFEFLNQWKWNFDNQVGKWQRIGHVLTYTDKIERNNKAIEIAFTYIDEQILIKQNYEKTNESRN